MPFGMWIKVGPSKYVLHDGARCRHPANKIEPSMCSGDAVFLLNYFNHLLQLLLLFIWPPYGVGQAIIFSSCGFFFLFLSFFYSLAYSQPSHIGCLPYFHTWCGGLSANLRCRSETCCTWLGKNTGRKKLPKIRYLGTNAQICRVISSQLRHVSTIRKQELIRR